MNKTQYSAGLALLGMALVGSWAALAPVQSNGTRPVLDPVVLPPVGTPVPDVMPPAGCCRRERFLVSPPAAPMRPVRTAPRLANACRPQRELGCLCCLLFPFRRVPIPDSRAATGGRNRPARQRDCPSFLPAQGLRKSKTSDRVRKKKTRPDAKSRP